MARRNLLLFRVFPTHVGVNRNGADGEIVRDGIPHARGGEPKVRDLGSGNGTYSPRTWG